MNLSKRLELLFESKGKTEVNMDALMEDFDVIRPFLRGSPLSMNDPLVVSINEPAPKKDITTALSKVREAVEALQNEKQAVEALLEIGKRVDESITSMVDLRGRLESLRVSLEQAEKWIAQDYNPKGGASPKHYPDMQYIIALFKEHVDPKPTSSPSGLFSEFVNEIVLEIDPNSTISNLRTRIDAALADTANIIDLENFRTMDPAVRRQFTEKPAAQRPLIQIDHPRIKDWNEFLKKADGFLNKPGR